MKNETKIKTPREGGFCKEFFVFDESVRNDLLFQERSRQVSLAGLSCFIISFLRICFDSARVKHFCNVIYFGGSFAALL